MSMTFIFNSKYYLINAYVLLYPGIDQSIRNRTKYCVSEHFLVRPENKVEHFSLFELSFKSYIVCYSQYFLNELTSNYKQTEYLKIRPSSFAKQ